MYEDILPFFDTDDTFLLSTHINADGDGLSAMLALAAMLRDMGRNYRMVVDDLELDRRYAFLGGYSEIESVATMRDRPSFGRAVFLDTPTSQRTGEVEKLVTENTQVLIIDHHRSEEEEGDFCIVDEGASATAELVLRLIQAMDVEVTPEIATQIYSGIAFDTKLFKFSKPDRALKACAELVDCGADPAAIAESLFAQETYETMKTLGFALTTLKLHFAGRAATLHVDHKTYMMGGELDVVVDHAMAIAGVEVGLFFKEEALGRHRVSLRSSGRVNVNTIARQFGGGGHRNASGCAMEAPLEELEKALLEQVRRALGEPTGEASGT